MIASIIFILLGAFTVFAAESVPSWEKENPVAAIPESPLGIDSKLSELSEPPTPERVRLGRWLFFDKRLSKDHTISCATCHRPENAFSEPTAHSTGIRGQHGARKSPSFINQAWTIYPHFFWDGRANSLEDQALGPVSNPLEMGNTHEAMIQTLGAINAYKKYFAQAFGTEQVTKDRIAKAIADYERTRLSGNSAWDKWKAGDENAVGKEVKAGDELFNGKAACNQCHLGQNFTDSNFHNLGIGWNAKTKTFKDPGRVVISKELKDSGAFKTPTIREITKHAPYMHDGSLKTLEAVVEHYNVGGIKNPHLDPKMKPLNLTKSEVKSLVKFMQALDGHGYQDTAPKEFPH